MKHVATPFVVVSAVDALLSNLMAAGSLTADNRERALRASEANHERPDIVLRKLGLISDEAITDAWSGLMGIAVVEAKDYPTSAVLAETLSREFLLRTNILPLQVTDDGLTLAVADPLDDFAPAAIAAKTGLSVQRRLGRPGELAAVLAKLYGDDKSSEVASSGADDAFAGDIERLRDLASDAPVIRFVNDLIDRAVQIKASDVHVSAGATTTRVRVRVDGVLSELSLPTAASHAAVISRLKILAGLDIAERRLPQDGRIRITWRGRDIDLRIATMPHLHGEGAILRVLDRSTVEPDLDQLGFGATLGGSIRKVLDHPHGIVLVTGPTGSGKTTTLYAALTQVARPDRNVITVEDPVEYQLPGVNQVQVSHRIGLDFATALRAALRQDPDVIMVGEIRDTETAAVANQAALTGHLVLATLHTNTAAAALPRLIDMGVEPYLLASTMRAVLAQRLVRRLCPTCKAAGPKTELPPSARRVGASCNPFMPVGCADCRGTGFRGRVAIGELLHMTDAIRRLVMQAADEATIAAAATTAGMLSLWEDGYVKITGGHTSIDEVARVLGA